MTSIFFLVLIWSGQAIFYVFGNAVSEKQNLLQAWYGSA